jgi:hypothetical protein
MLLRAILEDMSGIEKGTIMTGIMKFGLKSPKVVKLRRSSMTNTEIKQSLDKINMMSHIEMASLYRFASPGHIYFDRSLPFSDVFMKRFNSLGGMTPEISKQIGWL